MYDSARMTLRGALTRLRLFRDDEDGAATIDWVVLTAASVGLGIAVMDKVTNGVENLANDIAAQLSAQSISTSFDSAPEDEG
jgi:Flp pilus assembly pilin Flp